MEMFNKDDLTEKASDAGLETLEKFATEKLGADKAEQIRRARDAADERIGNRGADRAPEQQQAPEATPEQPEQ